MGSGAATGGALVVADASGRLAGSGDAAQAAPAKKIKMFVVNLLT
jgi:hypothetical protein